MWDSIQTVSTCLPGFQLLNGRRAVLVVGDESIEPTAKLVLLLDDVVGDGTSTVVRRWAPTKGHRLVVKVNYVDVTWGTRRLCGRDNQ